MPRWAAILVVLAGFTVLFVAFLMYLVPALFHQVAALARALPGGNNVAAFTHQVDTAINSLPKGPRTIITAMLSRAEHALKTNLVSLVNGAVSLTATLLFGVINMILFLLGFTVVPIWLFFVLQSGHQGRDAVNRVLPEGMRADLWAVVRIVDRILSSWIRGQIILSLFLGGALFLGLELLTFVGVKGIEYPLLIAVFAALVAPIPYVGNVAGAAPALIMAFLSSWQSGLAVLVLFIIASAACPCWGRMDVQLLAHVGAGWMFSCLPMILGLRTLSWRFEASASSRRAASAAAGSTCSQLSSTSSRRRDRREAISVSSSSWPACSCRSSAASVAATTGVRSAPALAGSGARSTSQTPAG
jgi:AI-2E family transporter